MEELPHNDKEQDFYIWKINGFYIGEEFFKSVCGSDKCTENWAFRAKGKWVGLTDYFRGTDYQRVTSVMD